MGAASTFLVWQVEGARLVRALSELVPAQSSGELRDTSLLALHLLVLLHTAPITFPTRQVSCARTSGCCASTARCH